VTSVLSPSTAPSGHRVSPSPGGRPSGGPAAARGAVRSLARGLGVASLGLGLAQLRAPGELARLAGVDDEPSNRALIRAVGCRELLHAAGLLATNRLGFWSWTRVAGDAMDLATLGRALQKVDRRRRPKTATVTAAVAGITVLDLVAALGNSRADDEGMAAGGLHLTGAVTVNRPRDEVYRFWHRFENLPTFMYHLESVSITGDRRSHWRAAGPLGRSIEWDAEIVDDRPGELISWHSLPGSGVVNAGSVRFTPAPGGRGTEVRVQLSYVIPGGKLGAAVAKLFGEQPEQQVGDDLRRFKQVMETGEVVRSDGSPAGHSARWQLHQREAQPLPSRV
jgi:uncharacterized membrane protein